MEAWAGEVEKEEGEDGEVKVHGRSVGVREALEATYQGDISS